MSNDRLVSVTSVEVSRDGLNWTADLSQMNAAFRDLADGIQIHVRKMQQDIVMQAGTLIYGPVGMKYPSEPATIGIVNIPTKQPITI